MIEIGKYRHFKGGEYEVIAIAKHSETMEEMVVYKALDDAEFFWVRPFKMWDESVILDDKTLKRFVKIDD